MRLRNWPDPMGWQGAICWLVILGGSAGAYAQETVLIRPAPPSTPHVAVNRTNEEIAPPVTPAVSPGPLSLDACIALGFQHQPALDAARASLNAANTGRRAVDRLLLPRLFLPEYGIRRQQACLGVTIAEAGLTQAEWETRYAITRNFFTVQYIRAQDRVISEVLTNLAKARDRAQKLYENPPVDSKITKLDLESLDINIALVKGKKSQIDNGKLKAYAALREAMGLGHDYPLEIEDFDIAAMAAYKVKVSVKDAKGKIVEKDEWRPVYSLNKEQLIASAIANRGEIVQASTALRVTELEVMAQRRKFGLKAETFAASGDVHSKVVPQSVHNGDYKPGAFPLEWPSFMVGKRNDRAQRAADLSQRASAVVDKANSLVALDTEAQYLKWQEAIEEIVDLSSVQELARQLPDKVQKLNPGEFTSGAVIQANITAISVRAQLNDAIHMHALALAGLERATAGAFRALPAPSPGAALPK